AGLGVGLRPLSPSRRQQDRPPCERPLLRRLGPTAQFLPAARPPADGLRAHKTLRGPPQTFLRAQRAPRRNIPQRYRAEQARSDRTRVARRRPPMTLGHAVRQARGEKDAHRSPREAEWWYRPSRRSRIPRPTSAPARRRLSSPPDHPAGNAPKRQTTTRSPSSADASVPR